MICLDGYRAHERFTESSKLTPFLSGFQDEMVKVAAVKSVARFLERLHKNPELRGAIARSAALGAGTGALTNLLHGDQDKGALRKILTGGAVGAAGGAVTGSAFPGWFGKSNMYTSQELAKLR